MWESSISEILSQLVPMKEEDLDRLFQTTDMLLLSFLFSPSSKFV